MFRNLRLGVCVLVVAGAALAAGCDAAIGGSEAAASRRSTGEIIGGTTTSCMPSVGSMDVWDFRATSFGHCTVTLVAPDVVMTAAHCANTVRLGESGVMNMVSFPGGRAAEISEVYIHPEWNGCTPQDATNQPARSTGDLAFLRLASPISRVAPARIGPLPVVGSSVTIIGQGQTTTTAGSWDRRSGTFQVDAIDPSGRVSIHGVDAGACPGDSGAPLLQGGDCSGRRPPTIVGVVSAGRWDGTICTVGSNLFAASATTGTGTDTFVSDVLAGRTPAPPQRTDDCCNPAYPQSCDEAGLPHACGLGVDVCPPCAAGTRACGADFHLRAECVGRVAPVAEICANGVDEDCNGTPDDGCVPTDPCSGSTDPCCGSTDPCCGSTDPCCGSTDPCCGSDDPSCGGPCAGVECTSVCDVYCCGDSCASDADCNEGDRCLGCACTHGSEPVIYDSCSSGADCAAGEVCYLGGCRMAGEVPGA